MHTRQDESKITVNSNRINGPTFWGEAESIYVAVVPMQGCVCVLFFLVEVSPEGITAEG